MVAAGLVAFTACSDYDDYNSDPLDSSASANKTLWENISTNENLSDFASLLKKAGMDSYLSQPTFYTIFAPLNGTFDASSLMQQDSATLRSHFAENHIANYNHQVIGTMDERIKALNEKSYVLRGSGDYTFGGVRISQANLPSVNGVMHTLNGEVNYYPNVYEYIYQAADNDSVAGYFKHYEHTTLDEENSVVGPVVNGRQTYIDSVMVTDNDLYRALRAYIAREDSDYTMVLPSNKAWADMYAKITPYYKYINSTVYQDVANATSATVYATQTTTINAAYYTDSIAKRRIAQMLIFNNNDKYNRWVENGGENTDTIATNAFAISNPTEYLAQTKEKLTMSNGYTRLVDSLAVHPWDTYAQEVRSLVVGKSFTSTTENVTVNFTSPLPDGSTSLSYFHAAPTSNYSRPTVVMMLPDALSCAYNLYVVLVPPFDNFTEAQTRPNKLNFSVSFCNANGTIRATQNLNQNVTNDPTRIDTVYVGTVTFPVCYYGFGGAACPNLKITTGINVFNATDMATYTRDVRIAKVIMRPVEYDEYLGNTH